MFYVGLLIFAAGGIGSLFAAFKTSAAWGVGCLLLPPLAFVFLFLHWNAARNPFLLQLMGAGLMWLGASRS